MTVKIGKEDLAAVLAEKTGVTKAASKEALEAVLEQITTTLKAGGEVNLPGFGKFRAKDVPAREGRNPRTGEKTAIPAQRKPAFSAAKGLKDALQA